MTLYWIGSLVLLLVVFPIVVILLHGEGPITRALSLPIWRRLATLGYGVYLVHIPILDHVLVPLAVGAFRHGWPLWVIWPMMRC